MKKISDCETKQINLSDQYKIAAEKTRGICIDILS